MSTSPKLGYTELTAGQAVPESTVNEIARYLEQGAAKFTFKSRTTAAEPGSPSDGDCYLLTGSPTGTHWSGNASKIAFYENTAWVFLTAKQGFMATVNDESNVAIYYTGSAWASFGGTTGALLAANNLSDVASASTSRTNLGVAIGTNVQAWDADLDALAALTGTNTIYYRSAANTWTGVTIGSGISFSAGTLSASGSGGTVSTTGSPANGNLTKFSGASSITNGDLSGDVTTSGTLAATVANINYSATITATGTPPTNAPGYLGCPQNTQNGTYTTVMSDAGKHIYHTSGSAHTWTIDSNANVAYPIGTILTFINENGGGNVTIAITSDTLRWGSSTGSRTLAANGTATAIKVASTTWRLTGDGIT
jgi:hypothetical protein